MRESGDRVFRHFAACTALAVLLLGAPDRALAWDTSHVDPLDAHFLKADNRRRPLSKSCTELRREDVRLSHGSEATVMVLRCPDESGAVEADVVDIPMFGMRFRITQSTNGGMIDDLRVLHLAGGTQLLIHSDTGGSGPTQHWCLLDDIGGKPICVTSIGATAAAKRRAVGSGALWGPWIAETGASGNLCFMVFGRTPSDEIFLISEVMTIRSKRLVPQTVTLLEPETMETTEWCP